MDAEEGAGNRASPSKAAVSIPTTPSPIQSPLKPLSTTVISPGTSPAASPSYDTRVHFVSSVQGTSNNNSNSNIGENQTPIESDGNTNAAGSVTDESCASHAVLLGIQTLERQQEELERKRSQRDAQRANPFDVHGYALRYGVHNQYHYQPQDNTDVPSTVHLNRVADGDSTLCDSRDKSVASVEKRHSRVKSMTKFLKQVSTPLKPIRRTISDKFNNDPTPLTQRIPSSNADADASSTTSSERRMKPIIFGNLHKLGRNGKWQKRWFESDGTHLRYFKTKERIKILATLDLSHVGEILMDGSDSSGCTFNIEVSGRQYYLCADTKERARDWVITLNRIKEARMQIGGLKLINPYFDGAMSEEVNPSKKTTNSDSDEERVAARVVMAAARPRTRGLGKGDDFSEMERSLDGDDVNVKGGRLALQETVGSSSPSSNTPGTSLGSPSAPGYRPDINIFASVPQMQDQIEVRWTKQRSAVQNWARRMSRWAKRMTMVRCVVKNDVIHYNGENQQQRQRAQASSSDRSNIQEDDNEEPFIDLDIARYSNCPGSYVEGQISADSSTSRPHYEYKTQKIVDPSVSESSVQSSAAGGRISPIPDDESGIIA
jgi:hypothetical protein